MTTEKVLMYKDFSLSELWDTNEFEVEFKGKTARVKNNSAFSLGEVSRFNKLSNLGQTTRGFYYGLTVNGCKAYFTSKHDINKTI